MSRIGKKPIDVPAGVSVSLDPKSHTINVDGPKGKMSYEYRPEVTVNWDESEKQIVCSIPEAAMSQKQMRAYWGTVRSRIQNMVTGTTDGYVKNLRIEGVGWNAQAQGKSLRLNIGFCHPVDMTPPAGVAFEVENNNRIKVSGVDKAAVGQFAAEVRSKRPPEPYKGKGIMYIDEVIIRKQGKVFGA